MTTNDDAREALTLVDGEWRRPCSCSYHPWDGMPSDLTAYLPLFGTPPGHSILMGKVAPHLHLCEQHRTEQDWQRRAEGAEKALREQVAEAEKALAEIITQRSIARIIHANDETEVKALRDERDRLREALANMWPYIEDLSEPVRSAAIPLLTMRGTHGPFTKRMNAVQQLEAIRAALAASPAPVAPAPKESQ